MSKKLTVAGLTSAFSCKKYMISWTKSILSLPTPNNSFKASDAKALTSATTSKKCGVNLGFSSRNATSYTEYWAPYLNGIHQIKNSYSHNLIHSTETSIRQQQMLRLTPSCNHKLSITQETRATVAIRQNYQWMWWGWWLHHPRRQNTCSGIT